MTVTRRAIATSVVVGLAGCFGSGAHEVLVSTTRDRPVEATVQVVRVSDDTTLLDDRLDVSPEGLIEYAPGIDGGTAYRITVETADGLSETHRWVPRRETTAKNDMQITIEESSIRFTPASP